MGHPKTTRGRTIRAILASCVAALSFFAFSTPPALADPPSHTPVPSLDLPNLTQACGAATDSKGDLYASSPGTDEIKVYGPAPTRELLTSIANANDPCGLAVDSKGNLYVSETATGNVVKYHPTTFPFAGTPTYEAPTTIDATGKAKGIAVDRTDDRLYVAEGNRIAVYKSGGSLEEINEVQQVTVSGASGGSFKLKFKGSETAPIPFNASAAEVQTALEALSTIGAGNVAVSGTYQITFTGALAHTDVETLGTVSSLTPGGAKVTVTEATKGFNGYVAEDPTANYTGVAAYTYIYTLSSLLIPHSYLYVADAATDEVKTFAAKKDSPLKLRRTITGVDADENPQTPEQGFGFGSQGAYLAADPGNESRATRGCAQVQVEGQDQACTQGHFFLYDAANEAVDEFDASGEFVDQVTNGSFTDAEPTALAVERSGTSSDGTLYVGAGASTGAKLVAFRPLGMPARDHLPALSRALTKARGVATDCNGYVYVAAEAFIRVYDPVSGSELTKFTDAESPRDLAADCAGHVYAVDRPSSEEGILTYYTPSAYPPTATTTYTRHEPLIAGEEGKGMSSVAVNPANEHAFVIGDKDASFTPIIAEFGPPAEGSAMEGECGAGLSLPGQRLDIDVYGATGEVYFTANPRTLATLRCGAEPELLIRQIKGGGCPSGEFGSDPTIALDQSNGHIVQFDRSNPGSSAREYDSSGACVAQFGSFSTGTGTTYRVAVDNSCALHDPPLSEQTTPKCSSLYPSDGNTYVAFDGADNTVQPYDVNAFGPLEYPIPPGEGPTVVTGGADGFGPGKATLHGEVNPNSSQIEECRFEYLTEAEYQGNGETFAGAEEEVCAESPEAIGNGGKAVPVHADVEGLQVGSAYRYRLLAANEFDTGEGEAKSLTLKAAEAEAKSALPVSYVEATLRGEVDPAGSPSGYRFEYLTQAEYEENEAEPFATAQSTPTKELPGTEGAVAVKAPLTGLQEGTEYRFRLLAENAVGSDSEEGPAFETLKRLAPQECANAEYRTGLGAFLPDCRAYELATPAQTFSTSGGLRPLGTFTSVAGHRFANSWFVAPRGPGAGESLSFQANVAHIDGHIFRARRGEGDHPKEGWQSEPYGFSFAQAAGAGGEPGGVSADQRYFLHEILAHETPTAEAFPVGSYLRVPAGEASRACAPEPKAQFEASDPEGAFELVGCGSKGSDPKAEGRFVSAGGTHVIFSSEEELEAGSPPAGTEAIYDREAGKASAEVVSVDPDGLPFGAGARYYATSEDGKAVVFGVGGGLYVHRAGGETTQVASSPYTYAGISEDGKRVFFMDAVFSPASVDDQPPPAGLFACDVQAGSCTAEAKPGLTEIAAKSSFVNVSADGSHAFFASAVALSGAEENENGETANEGEPNLYAWDGAQIRFVAVLDPQDLDGFRKGPGKNEVEPQEDLLAWTSVIPGQLATSSGLYESGRAYSPTRSTPDGEVFAFQSHAQLTDYDNGGKGEIYRYAPAAPVGAQLTCVSCDPSGAPHDGAADALFDTVVLGDINSSAMIPNITDDGQRVFFESREALLPGDANEVTDVYEWKAAGVSGPGGGTCEEARGCLALISTGQGEVPSYLFGMSADGSDVFFETPEKLAGADVIGSFSIYDARELGGIPDPPLAAPCQGDACQGQGSTPPALPASASTGQGNGNEEPKPRSCAKGKQRVKGRCVKPKHRKHHRKHSKQHRANRKRGAGR